RVAVVAMVVDCVAAVSMLPLAARKELVLRLGGAGGEAHRVALVQSLHFLQEHEVRIELAQAIAQFVDHHAAIEMRQSLVDVESRDAQALGRHPGPPRSRWRRRSSRSASSKYRLPTRALACRPRWRMAPGDAIPIGRIRNRSARSSRAGGAGTAKRLTSPPRLRAARARPPWR